MKSDHIPVIVQWLEGLSEPELADFARFADPMPDLTLLWTASQSSRFPVFPDTVLAGWHYILATTITMVDQSTLAFIAEAKRAGWTADRIATAVELDDVGDLTKFREEVAQRLVDRHPSSVASRKRPAP